MASRRQRAHMRHLPWIALALAVIALVLLGAALFKTQKQLRELRSELGTSNGQLVQAWAASSELESVVANLKIELDTANKARTELQSNLDEADSDNDELFDAAQSALNKKQAQVKDLTAQLEKAKTAADEASAEIAKREQQVSKIKEQLASEHKTGQDQIEGLNKAVEDTKAKLTETQTRVADLTEQLEALSAQVAQITTERDAAQSSLSEKESYIKVIFAKAKDATEWANARIAESDKAAAEAAEHAKTERDKLQSALNQATAELKRLADELRQKEADSKLEDHQPLAGELH